MKNECNIQVDNAYYYNLEYDNLERFISYYNQIKSLIAIKHKNILEVGIGNKFLSNYLKNMGYKVTTCDFNKSLNPDYVADVRHLPFNDNSFDIVVAFEVLEHLPFEDFEKSLSELKRVSKKNVIISLPYSCIFLNFDFNISLLFYKSFSVCLRIPFFFIKPIANKINQHYWELGKRNFSRKRIRNILKNYFKIKKEYFARLDPEHYFFVLEK